MVQPPTARYAALMLGTTALAAGATFLVAQSLGSAQPATLALAAYLAASIATFAPVLFGSMAGPERWGLLVLGASMARMLLLIAFAAAFTKLTSVTPRPLWYGALTGAGITLAVETVLAVMFLSRIERQRLPAAGRDRPERA